MDWEDTVMSEEELINAYEIDNPADDHAIGCHSLALKQAKISFKAGYTEGTKAASFNFTDLDNAKKVGMRKVVEWIENLGGSLDGLHKQWQAFKESEGIKE